MSYHLSCLKSNCLSGNQWSNCISYGFSKLVDSYHLSCLESQCLESNSNPTTSPASQATSGSTASPMASPGMPNPTTSPASSNGNEKEEFTSSCAEMEDDFASCDVNAVGQMGRRRRSHVRKRWNVQLVLVAVHLARRGI